MPKNDFAFECQVKVKKSRHFLMRAQKRVSPNMSSES